MNLSNIVTEYERSGLNSKIRKRTSLRGKGERKKGKLKVRGKKVKSTQLESSTNIGQNNPLVGSRCG